MLCIEEFFLTVRVNFVRHSSYSQESRPTSDASEVHRGTEEFKISVLRAQDG